MLPIFDSLAHPTLSGNWLKQQNQVATFEKLQNELTQSHYLGACAIGMADIEGYEHEAFIQNCRKIGHQLVPIAGFNPVLSEDVEKELDLIQKLGFKGIKIHPRFSKIELGKHDLGSIFKSAAKRNLVIFYCTYLHCSLHSYPTVDPFFQLIEWLKVAPEAKVVLVHGGDVQVLRYAELVRFNPNLLLDLSLTIMKYAGSSIDMDIRFLFQQFDRRICIGTDFPEYTHEALRQRFDYFSKDIATIKKENIAFKNLINFLST